MVSNEWLLLLHQIPPRPAYLRAKVMRRLGQVGALAIKNSAYLLPGSEETREDFEWLAEEIRQGGGSAWLFRVEPLAGLTPLEIEESFRRMRALDYEELTQAARDLLAGPGGAEQAGARSRLAERFEKVKEIDFFHCPARDALEALMEELDQRERQAASDTPAPASQGGIWVTRKGIRVDRIGSAWLIRRFIDPKPLFRFVDPASYRHSAPELRFDMFEGEYTHEGSLCTFEVLVERHRLLERYPGLKPLAEMVHDLDLKDSLYQRPETAGLSRMLDGLCASTPGDEQRLERGAPVFDALYESFTR